MVIVEGRTGWLFEFAKRASPAIYIDEYEYECWLWPCCQHHQDCWDLMFNK